MSLAKRLQPWLPLWRLEMMREQQVRLVTRLDKERESARRELDRLNTEIKMRRTEQAMTLAKQLES